MPGNFLVSLSTLLNLQKDVSPSDYVNGEFVGGNGSISVKSLAELEDWSEAFTKLREDIINSSDPKRFNYAPQRLDISAVDEMSVVFFRDQIIAFSAMISRPIFPANTARVLSRFWKTPEIRGITKSYWFLSKLMLEAQLRTARKRGHSAVFISTEGMRRKWISRWAVEASSDDSTWELMPNLGRVCTDNFRECWQNIAFTKLDPNFDFKMETLSFEEWQLLPSERDAPTVST